MRISYLKYFYILLIVFILSMLGSFAYFSWGSDTSSNTNVSFDVVVETVYIEYDAGSDIEGANLYPVDDKSDGISKDITVKTDKVSSKPVTFNLYLDLTDVPEELMDDSFKWAIYRDNELVASDSITKNIVECSKNNTNHIVLVNNETVDTTLKKYTLYLWIDGNMTNPDTMMNKSFKVKLHADGVNSLLLKSTLSVGDYVLYTPSTTSYVIDKLETGYKEEQTINPSELNLWRVLKINDDNTIELVSEYVSSKSISFGGQTGYLNFIGCLNKLAKQYENSNYTIGSRYLGYNGQTEYITDTSKFITTAPWTSSTLDNSNESQGGGDILYTDDYNQLLTALGTRVAYKVETNTATYYWMASRYYRYASSSSYFWYCRRITSSGEFHNLNLFYYNNGSFGSDSYGNSLRPIVILKSGLKYVGDGSIDSPIKILS